MTGAAGSSDEASIRVLICDDHRELRAAVAAVLGLRPLLRIVGVASDGNEAIAQAARLQPDVILLDLAMPNRSGLQSLSELREVAPSAKIIAFSGFSATHLREYVLKLGAVLYLEKTASAETINDAIEHAAGFTLLPAPNLAAEHNRDRRQPTRMESSTTARVRG